MTTGPAGAQVLVRVQPRVLGDALCLTLREHAVDAFVCPVADAGVADRPIDIAIVSDELPRELVARSVVVLGEDGRAIRVLRAGHEEQAPTGGGLGDLLALIIDLASEPGES